MNILCYVESNSATGLGHYTRIKILLSLLKVKKVTIVTANYWLAKKIFAKYTIKKKPKNLKKFLVENLGQYTHFILDPPYYEKNKKINKGDYWFFLKKIKNIKTSIIRLTDEVNPSRHDCDILINDFPGSSNFKKYYKKNCLNLFLGENFFLYKQDLLKLMNNKNKKKYDLIIVFGGEDPKNILLKYFFFLKSLNLKKIFICSKKIYSRLKANQNKNNKKLPPLDQYSFFSYLKKSRIYLSTPSNIMFETYALGLNGVVIPTQDRQKIMGHYFQKNFNNVICLEKYDKLRVDDLKKAIDKMFNSYFKKFKINVSKNILVKSQNKLIKCIKNYIPESKLK